MSNRYFSQLPPHVTLWQTWGNKSGWGRFWKRKLNRARRQFGRAYCREGERAYQHMQGLPMLESEVRYKLW